MESLVTKGRRCIEAAQRAHTQSQQTDRGGAELELEETLHTLTALQQDARHLKQTAQEKMAAFTDQEKKLKHQVTALSAERSKHESIHTALNCKKKIAQCKLEKKQRSLCEGERKLTKAKERLRNTRSEVVRVKGMQEASSAVSTAGAIATSIAGVGLGALLNVVISDDAASGAREERVRKAESNAKSKAEDVTKMKKSVAMAEGDLCSVQKELDTCLKTTAYLSRKGDKLASKIDTVAKLIAFQQEVVDFWELFLLASGPSQISEHAQYLEQVVRKAMEIKERSVSPELMEASSLQGYF